MGYKNRVKGCELHTEIHGHRTTAINGWLIFFFVIRKSWTNGGVARSRRKWVELAPQGDYRFERKNIWFSYLNPNASRCSSSSHMDRLRTCSIRSSVSCDSRVCVTFNPRKNVLYSRAETIAVKSLRTPQKKTITSNGCKLQTAKCDLKWISKCYSTYFGSKWSKSRKFSIRVSCDR